MQMHYFNHNAHCSLDIMQSPLRFCEKWSAFSHFYPHRKRHHSLLNSLLSEMKWKMLCSFQKKKSGMILLRLEIKHILFTSFFSVKSTNTIWQTQTLRRSFHRESESHFKDDKWKPGDEDFCWSRCWTSATPLCHVLMQMFVEVGINPIKTYCFRGDPHPGVAQNWIYMSCEFSEKCRRQELIVQTVLH